MNETKRRFVICLRGDGAGDLELHKLYNVLTERRLRKGDLGAVVMVYEPDGIEVECVRVSGRTQALDVSTDR